MIKRHSLVSWISPQSAGNCIYFVELARDFEPLTTESSTFTLSFDGELSGWFASLASGLLRNQARKDMQRDLANLKAKLESS